MERYAGPVGTTVTIQQTPQPPFGLPGLPPMPGPSISIRNPGRGQRPQVRIFVGGLHLKGDGGGGGVGEGGENMVDGWLVHCWILCVHKIN